MGIIINILFLLILILIYIITKNYLLIKQRIQGGKMIFIKKSEIFTFRSYYLSYKT